MRRWVGGVIVGIVAVLGSGCVVSAPPEPVWVPGYWMPGPTGTVWIEGYWVTYPYGRYPHRGWDHDDWRDHGHRRDHDGWRDHDRWQGGGPDRPPPAAGPGKLRPRG
jgi:hypothetical protein